MSKFWYKILLGIMILLNIILFTKFYNLKFAQAHTLTDVSSYMVRMNLPNVAVTNKLGESFFLPQLAKKYAPAIFIFFSPSDCPNCLSEIPLWKEIEDTYNMNVLAIATASDSNEFWQWEAFTKIPVTVYLDTSYAVVDSMGFSTTPIKVLLNQNGIPVWASPPCLTKTDQEEFYRELEYAVEKYL